MVPALLFLAVEFYRAPLRYGHLTDPTQALPDAFGTWLLESRNALAPARIQATADGLGMRPAELQDAFRFFLRHTLMLPRADHYRVLGLSRDCTTESVKRHHSMLVRMFHPDRAPAADEHSAALAARINSAYEVLRDSSKRRRYDRDLVPSTGGFRSAGDGRDFFQPRDRAQGHTRHRRSARGVPVRARPIVLWVLVGLAVASLLFYVLREPPAPSLRIGPQSTNREAPGPAFLHGGRGDRAFHETRRRTDADPVATAGSAPTRATTSKPDER